MGTDEKRESRFFFNLKDFFEFYFSNFLMLKIKTKQNKKAGYRKQNSCTGIKSLFNLNNINRFKYNEF